jgi:site-specific recombinase XerC
LHPHDLWHTTAIWHYGIHKDLLALRQFGGWANLDQVQVYAHLLSEAHVEAVRSWLGWAPVKRV